MEGGGSVFCDAARSVAFKRVARTKTRVFQLVYVANLLYQIPMYTNRVFLLFTRMSGVDVNCHVKIIFSHPIPFIDPISCPLATFCSFVRPRHAKACGEEISCGITVSDHLTAVRIKVRQQWATNKTQHDSYGRRARME